MKDYKFTCVPKNLMLALDGNCKVMLFTLLQYSDYTAGEDGWFYAPNSTLQNQAGLSKNLVIATLDTLYRAGIIDVECVGVGTARKSNRIKVNTSSFDKYDEYKVENILGNPELQIRTVDYKNNYSPSYLQESKKVCKEVCKKVNTIIDNIENIDNIDKDITVLENIPIKEKETYKEKEMEKPTQELDRGGSPSSRLSVFEDNIDKTYQLPEMEKRLELQYMDILKHLPVYEKMHPGTGEVEDSVAHYTSETCDFFEPLNGETMSYMMLRWFDGGREKMAELVQGRDPKNTKEILTYMVLYCKTSDERYNNNTFQTVYA